MQTTLAVIALIASLFCIFAVFYDKWDDNLGQRTALAILSISLYSVGRSLWENEGIHDSAVWSLGVGFTLFGVSTLLRPATRRDAQVSAHHPVHH
jgi:uncharacterized membrane protein